MESLVLQPQLNYHQEFENALKDENLTFTRIEENALSGEEVVRFALDVAPHAWTGLIAVVAAIIARGQTVLVIKEGDVYEVQDAMEIKKIVSEERSGHSSKS